MVTLQYPNIASDCLLQRKWTPFIFEWKCCLFSKSRVFYDHIMFEFTFRLRSPCRPASYACLTNDYTSGDAFHTCCTQPFVLSVGDESKSPIIAKWMAMKGEVCLVSYHSDRNYEFEWEKLLPSKLTFQGRELLNLWHLKKTTEATAGHGWHFRLNKSNTDTNN